MGSSEAEQDQGYTSPRLPLLRAHAPYKQSPERSGMLTPPLQTSASVPFRWEEEPGKPRLCTTTAISNPISELTPPRCLELPPRLLLDSSPTTVLEGPYIGKTKFQSSSFRIIRRREWYGSFRKTLSPERGPLERGSTIVLSKKVVKEKRFLGSWIWSGRKGRREAGGGSSYVFPSSSSTERSESDHGSYDEDQDNSFKKLQPTSLPRTGSFSSTLSSQSRSQFWATIYEGLKQVVPWRSNKKQNKDGHGLVN